MIESSMMINDRMPEYCVERAGAILNRFKKALNGAKVLVLGVAYKQDIDDYRESPAIRVIEEFEKVGSKVVYYDPYVPEYKHKGNAKKGEKALTAQLIKGADLVVITTAHTKVDYEFVQKNAKVIFDTKNVMKGLKARGNRQIKKGDEVITVACAFPTTVTPIIQYGAVPVFVDVTVPEYDIDVAQLEKAYSHKTKAVMIAHSLGNPFNLQAVKSFCDKHNLWLVEDNCDALGSTYKIKGTERKTGTIGDIGTSSFYPPHHMTMGEGGAVYTNNPLLHRLINSYRDWGRDCWCPSGKDNTCGQRFTKQYGELPLGYDHKYVYSHLGYNLKITDMQAAIGCAQLKKLDKIVETRRKNFQYILDGLKGTKGLILPVPQKNSNPSWFGFLISVKENAGFTRNELTKFLEERKIQTRNLFAGNLLRHPAFINLDKESTGENKYYRVIGGLKNTDFIMNNTFWIGVYPGMKKPMLDWMIKSIKEFCDIKRK
ncbi:MAG: lipopolysaccharide biosynthesis protein RfbH [Bacteroidales bacterium]|jgi:CDP-6-deoxy-D-xylo-4-hexulose-3-dehydrase|nr:lipopolysaccharide biosynthesis protein RfbH [Bacteroidales bacterium]